VYRRLSAFSAERLIGWHCLVKGKGIRLQVQLKILVSAGKWEREWLKVWSHSQM